MTRARWIALAVIVLAAVFAWTGGTYSHRNFAALRVVEHNDSARVQMLTREIDSLRAFGDSLARDPAVQERVAREQFGMSRPGELTFTILPDSGMRKGVSRP